MYKEKIFMLLILAIGLVAIANAVNDSVIMGPYKVSFDIGQKKGIDYTVVNVTTTSNESANNSQKVYSVVIKNSALMIKAGVDIVSTNSPVNSTSSSRLKTLMDLGFSRYWKASKWGNRTIDGMPGKVAELKDSKGNSAYSAAYYLPGENDTNILIYSSWPFTDTAKLLNSIHVERLEKAT